MSLSTSPGIPFPLGCTENKSGVNFAIYIKNAHEVFICLFNEANSTIPFEEIKLDPLINKTGETWHIAFDSLPSFTLYNYRVIPQIDKGKCYHLLDPYAKGISSHSQWGEISKKNIPYKPLGKFIPDSYDWEGDRPLNIPLNELIIYEMHVRGFTQHPSSGVDHLGTFSGIKHKIPYLKSLGINAVELLPIFEFNECETQLVNPKNHQKLHNFFGYSTVNFFSPMNRYAAQCEEAKALNEFKDLVKALHQNGIEVILDVVFNHTFEGSQTGPSLCFRGLDAEAYYMINDQGAYLNFSGCGNTINSNHPIVIEWIIQALRYWVVEMHIDGFRFDLASIMTRDEDGTPLAKAPLVEAISKDPCLSQTKLIAEAWDAAGLYQVGSFYRGKRWSEWNGKYRDCVRRFIKGTPGNKTAFATCLAGSQDLYGWRGSPLCSVNFVTAHDGFSLADLVSYNDKHNEENGEQNKDGFDHNDSWNCGVEGPSHNKKIISLRDRQMRNFLLALSLSQGIPMFSMGDEYAHTRKGNNNTWCQDNELNWFLWDHLDKQHDFHRFFKGLIEFRKNEPLLRHENFLTEQDVTWHGVQLMNAEWDKDNGFVAFTLNNQDGIPKLYAAFNASTSGLTVAIPLAPKDQAWHWVVNTNNSPPDDFYDANQRKLVDGHSLKMGPFSAVLLTL